MVWNAEYNEAGQVARIIAAFESVIHVFVRSGSVRFSVNET